VSFLLAAAVRPRGGRVAREPAGCRGRAGALPVEHRARLGAPLRGPRERQGDLGPTPSASQPRRS